MYNENNNEDLTNDKLCVCEDVSIPAHERASIDRVIEMYENGDLHTNDFISFDEFERRIRRAAN